MNEFIAVVKDWQTLLSAVLALVAAGCTIYTMRRQMRADTIRHEDALERKKKAARAQLPDALVELTDHIRAKAALILTDDHTPLTPPIAALSTLKAAIEFVDDDAASRLFELVSWYQVWSVRLRREDHDERVDSTRALYDSTMLMCYVNSLFEYGRNEADSVNTDHPTRDEMMTGLRELVGHVFHTRHRDRFSGVQDLIDLRHNGSESAD